MHIHDTKYNFKLEFETCLICFTPSHIDWIPEIELYGSTVSMVGFLKIKPEARQQALSQSA